MFNSEDEFVRLVPQDISSLLYKQLELNLQAPLRWDFDKLRRLAEQDRALMKARHISYVSIVDGSYPALLREIYDPPAILYFRGVLPAGEKKVAVVGTRKPSAQALELTYRIARELGEAGIPVVSGLALGTDAIAHRGNIDGGGKTSAVLGSGADMVYPRSNIRLASRILETGGAIISEYPPGTPPAKWHFPERNRIVSGICPAVLAACAPAKSGALITADFALDQGRDLYVAVSGDLVFGDGCRRLLEDGAGKVSCAADIFCELKTAVPEKNSMDDNPAVSLAAELANELGLEL